MDIDNQSAGNYAYDSIGNMIKDNAEGITNISWTVYGKISQITKSNGTTITYTYDASGNRISKVITKSSPASTDTTWYVRDASGNVMSVYAQGVDSVNNGHLSQTELHLYGSSRLGILRTSVDVASAPNDNETSLPLLNKGYGLTFARGKKLFELSNHLGNVLVTISDKKLGYSSDGNVVDYFNPQVVSAQDYYPFGMLQPGREFNVGGYRYGFNGQENDNEVKGEGSQQDYGMRIYDPRLGKFLSVDPLTKQYPWLSPYQYAENSPIANIDLDGLESSYAADGRVVNGPFQNDPLTGGRLYGAPPTNTFAYVLDQSKRAAQQPAAQPKLIKLDVLQLPSQVKNTVAQVSKNKTFMQEAEDHLKRYGYDLRIPMVSYASSQDKVDKPRPNDGYSDFEYGMITSPATQASTMTICPGCAVTYGGTQVYSGIQTGNYWEIGSGTMNILSGGLSILNKFLPELNVGDKVSIQKQGRHLPGNQQGNLNVMQSAEEAQSVVDALHSGNAKIVAFKNFGKAGGGVTHVDVEYRGVTGTFYTKNLETGEMVQTPTNYFRIEGTGNKVKVFPINPARH